MRATQLDMLRPAGPAPDRLAATIARLARSRLPAAASAPPPSTAHGALLAHITGGHIETIDKGPRSFQPMNINFGLFPPLASPPTKKADGTRLRGNEKTVARKQAMSARALVDLDRWMADHLHIAAAA